MVAEDIIEKFAEINAENFTDGRVNFFTAFHPLVILVRNSEKIHNGKVIADHIVEAYRFFYSA